MVGIYNTLMPNKIILAFLYGAIYSKQLLISIRISFLTNFPSRSSIRAKPIALLLSSVVNTNGLVKSGWCNNVAFSKLSF